jgi:hypothetical protein
MQLITKEAFLNALSCPRIGWRTLRHQSTAKPSLADRVRMKIGQEIGEMARAVSGPGELVDEHNVEAAADHTQRALQSKAKVIYEATFIHEGYVTRADILKRQGRSWDLIEVKSSVNPRPELLDDVAYTTTVAALGGVELNQIFLRLLSRDFGYRDPPERAFVDHEATGPVSSKQIQIEQRMPQIKEVLLDSNEPQSKLGWVCRQCPDFEECLGKGIDYPVFDLPRLREEKFNQLAAMGTFALADIPKNFKLTPNQQKVRDAAVKHTPIISEGLADALGCIQWPAYYLDFETVMPPLPIYPGTHPYTQIPVQFSIHVCSEAGKVIAHHEYLADPLRDSRKDLCERLIAVIGAPGSVVTYSSFESRILNGLAELFPSHARVLLSIMERIVDLEPVVREHFCHPDFHGRSSIKSTLPVLVPDLSYDDLSIADGDCASSAFLLMARGDVHPDELPGLRSSLLTYCARDTLAMVCLHEALAKRLWQPGHLLPTEQPIAAR